jgi:hypothetical protein
MICFRKKMTVAQLFLVINADRSFPLQALAFRGRPVSLLGFACGVSPVPLFPQESSACSSNPL